MNQPSSEDLRKLVADALGLDQSIVTLDTSSANQIEWDSLGHLDILQRLEAEFPSITSENPGLGTAQSVREMVEILKLSE